MASGRGGSVVGPIRIIFGAGTPVGLNDAQLLDRFLAGSDEVAGSAFEVLVNRHGPMVLGVCRNALGDAHEAQDAFQATFLILARKAGSIRRRASLASWLFGVARKVAARARGDAARRRLRERAAAVPELVEPGRGREAEDFAALHEEIERLPASYRDPVVLCYLHGLTYEAAARQLRCPTGTLSIRLKRAKERLRARLERRGVVVPAGLPIAGLEAVAAKAAAPIAPSESSAWLTWRIAAGGAAVAGTVPAPVAALAGGTMAMMRFKAVGFVSLGLGILALASAASLMVRATEEGPGVAEQPPATRVWVRTLASGATVELLGASPGPSGPGTWYDPGGMRRAEAPYAASRVQAPAVQGQRAWEFAVRVGHRPEPRSARRWQILPPGGSSASGTPRDAAGEVLPGLEMIAVSLPEHRRSCTVRFGLASGLWKTEVTNGPERSARGRERLSVIFGTARDENGRAAVAISHDESEDDLRVVAVDLQGVEHTPARAQGSGVRDYVQLEVEYDLPLSKLKEFRLQSRPFEWAVFEDVALVP